MTLEEQKRMIDDAIRSSSENGTILVPSLLKAAQATPTKPVTPAAPASPTLLDRYDAIDKDLRAWGDKTFGPGGGNYASSGVGMAGLGALYGLLFGDKKHGTWDAVLNNALLFGSLGLGGQWLKNKVNA